MIVTYLRTHWILLMFILVNCQPSHSIEERWCDQLSRPIYQNLRRIPVAENWFEIYQVEEGVYAIYEPNQWQEVISYLILGKEKALLFDTGNGIGNIGKVVAALTNLSVVVLNSHTHFDHIGGNAEFSKILGMDTDYTRLSSKGKSNREVGIEVSEEALCMPLPEGKEKHHIKPFRVTQWISDGYIIELGDRQLEVLSIPGHTPDAIALLDRDRGLLWTGDSFYEGPIWLFVEETDLNAYGESVGRLAKLVPDLKRLLPAHNTPVANPSRLVDVRDAFLKVQSGDVEGEPRSKDRIEYLFEGFSFLMLKDK